MLLLVGLIMIAAFIFSVTRSREPSYQGKKLSDWLEEFVSGDPPHRA